MPIKKLNKSLDKALDLPTSLQEIMRIQEHGKCHRRKENTINQIQMYQFYRINNLVSSTKEGPPKVPSWEVGDHCQIKKK